MGFKFTLDKRLQKQIEEYCDINKLDAKTYITESLRRCLYIDKYGDLNELVKDKSSEPPKRLLKEHYSKITVNTEKKEVILTDSSEFLLKVDECIIVPEIKTVVIREEVKTTPIEVVDKEEKNQNINKETSRTRRQIQSK